MKKILLKLCQRLYFIHVLFHISSKFDFFIGVDMFMCHALICVKKIHVNDRSKF